MRAMATATGENQSMLSSTPGLAGASVDGCRPRSWLALLVFGAISAAACTAAVDGGDPGGTSGTGGSGGGGSGTGGGTPTGGNGAGHNVPPFMLACQQSKPGSAALRLLTANELVNSLRDIFPEARTAWTPSLPANSVASTGFDNDASITVGKQFAGGLLETAEAVATAVTGAPLANLLPCSTGASPDRSCADMFVSKYGRRLFRRPLAQAERDRFLTFFDTARAKTDFKTALKWTLAGLIQSPSAVYRSEVGVEKSSMRELTPFEVATALSYAFSGTTPDEALLAKAESGNLGDLVSAARQMLASDRGKEVMHRFFDGYVGYGRASSIAKPNVPAFGNLSAQMVSETRSFITDVIIAKGGGVRELLTSPTTYITNELADFYGFPRPASAFAPVMRPAGRGIGILAQGAFLASRAAPDASSPTLRGLFPYLRLLCRPKLEVPDNVPNISTPQPGAKTTRQRYELQHSAAAPCAFCHKQFDPIGFGFEHFDEVGRYRADEGGLPIDATGTVYKEDASTPLFSFNGQEDLATKLAAEPVVHQCVSAHLAAYAFGSTEPCLGAGPVTDLQAGKIGIVEAYARLAGEPHFSRRAANQ